VASTIFQSWSGYANSITVKMVAAMTEEPLSVVSEKQLQALRSKEKI